MLVTLRCHTLFNGLARNHFNLRHPAPSRQLLCCMNRWNSCARARREIFQLSHPFSILLSRFVFDSKNLHVIVNFNCQSVQNFTQNRVFQNWHDKEPWKIDSVGCRLVSFDQISSNVKLLEWKGEGNRIWALNSKTDTCRFAQLVTNS